MGRNDSKSGGVIFPELRDDATEESPEPHEQMTGWDDHPFDTDSVAEPDRFERAPRRAVVRETRSSSNGSLWLALLFLILVLVGVSCYGYQTLLDANIRLSQIPGMLKSLSTLNGRMTNLETQVGDWTGKFQGITGRVASLEKTVSADYRDARRHAEVLTAQLQKQIQDEMNARGKVVDSRLDQLTTAQKNAEQREAQIQQQLSAAQQQIASLRQETNQDLAQLNQHVTGNEEQMNSLARQMKHERVDFELSRNQISQLSPEISMDLTATDTQYMRFSGWVYFEPDQRYLWVRDQGVSQPLVFYDRQQGRQYQVVVTSIRQSSVAGYILLPESGGAPSTEATRGGPAGQ